MRKILPKKDIEKKQTRNQVIIALLLGFLMIGSTLGFALLSGERSYDISEKVNYNGFLFERNDQGYWGVNVQGANFVTFYNPQEIENLDLNLEVSLDDFYNKPFYYVGSNSQAMNEITVNFGPYLSILPQEVCLPEDKCDNEKLVRDCSNNIIIFVEKDSIKTYKEENCIFIEAPYNDQIKIVDKIIFKSIGIE
jgi:hypothetical protein